jgi:hypothetical protein
MPDSQSPRSRLAFWGALVLAVFVLLFARSMSRFFDLDEQQFVAPGVLLLREGLRPYVDYPYFHLPYLACIYAGVLWLSPDLLLVARIVSVACATATAFLLFRCGWSRLAGLDERRRWLFVGGLTATLLCCRLFTYASGWAWNHDAAVLAALACYLVHREGLHGNRAHLFLVSGFLLGLATGIRLTVAPAVVPLAVSAVLPLMGATAKSWAERLRNLVCFAAGGAVASLPALMLLWEAPNEFLFGNLTYPSLYGAFAQSAGGRATTVPGKVWHFLQSMLTDPGNALIAGIALFGLTRCVARWRRHSGNDLLLVALIAALWLGAMAPSQAQYQYNYVLFPFFVLAGFEVIAADRGSAVAYERWQRIIGVGAVVTVLSGVPRWYWGIINIASPRAWVPIEVHAAGAWVDSQLRQGVRIMTVDPLVALEGGRSVYPQFATGRFIFQVGPFMSAADRQLHHMPTGDALQFLLAREPPAAFLYDVRLEGLVPDFVAYARSHEFRPLDSPDGAYRLWVAPAATPSSVGPAAPTLFRGPDHP